MGAAAAVACASPTAARSRPAAIGGVLDLRSRDFASVERVELKGEWEFYWKQLLAPGETAAPTGYMKLPRSWKGYRVDSSPIGSAGYATFRLKVLLPADTPALALRVHSIYTSYALFVNGRELDSVGRVGTSAAQSTPAYRTRTVRLPEKTDALTISIQVANFSHYRGGIVNPIYLGASRVIFLRQDRAMEWDFFLIGAIVVLGLYQLGFFVLRTSDRSTLYLGLFCLLIALRTYLTGTHAGPLFGGLFSWQIDIRIEYLTVSLGFVAYLAFSRRLFRRDFRREIYFAGVTAGAMYSLLALVTPVVFFTRLLLAFQVLLLVSGLYYFYVLIRAVNKRRTGAVLLLGGFIILFVTLLNDILSNNGIIHTPFLFSAGVFVFLFAVAMVMSIRFARLYRQVRLLTRIRSELRTANESLRELSYVDALTGVSNRRHFDEFLRQEWSRGIRNGTTVGLLMLDIDGFKAYNDNYGHSAGDRVLQQVARTLQSSLKRSVDFFARYGGEEFVVVLPNTDLEGTMRVGEKMRGAVEGLSIEHHYSNTGTVITASIGAAVMRPTNGSYRGDLVDAADRAMYKAKNAGKNRVEST